MCYAISKYLILCTAHDVRSRAHGGVEPSTALLFAGRLLLCIDSVLCYAMLCYAMLYYCTAGSPTQNAYFLTTALRTIRSPGCMHMNICYMTIKLY